jgi:hypothetical protein
MNTPKGEQNVNFLTEIGLYRLLFKSKKPIALKFQNWAYNVIKEIRLTGEYKKEQLLKEKEEKILETEQKLKKVEENVKEAEETIKKLEMENSNLSDEKIPSIYIYNTNTGLSKPELKIGYTTNVHTRIKPYKQVCKRGRLEFSYQIYNKNIKVFESFIHNHESIRTNKVNNLVGHEKELELFLIGKQLSYQTLLDIINHNVKYFNGNDTTKLELEIEKLKLMLEMKNSNNDNLLIQELVTIVKQLTTKIDCLEKTNTEMLNKFNSQQAKITTGFSEPLPTLGPRLQKIHPETLQLIKVYESVTEAMKENPNIKRPSINKAILENTIYCEYRWLLVDRDLDPNCLYNLSPTKLTKPQNLGYIAQINNEKTEIINVYLDRKTASHFNGYENSSALDNPVKNFTLTKGVYYRLYDDCDDKLRSNFEARHGPPLLYKNGIGQFDSQNNLIREFSCKYDCIRSLSMSDKTLTKALEKNVPYNGLYFKEIGAKIKIL